MISNKGALSLLSVYGDDSSDDDVPECRVSSKRTHNSDDEDHESKTQKKRRLPLPSSLLNIRMDTDNVEDPSLHNGRIRTFPHERGNWATYVYVPFDDYHMGIVELINKIQNIIPTHLDVKSAENFHISLTKTVILKHHWIQSFMESVKHSICLAKRFVVLFDSIRIYCNEERTRTFIGIQIKTGYDMMQMLVQILNKCLQEYQLETFYKTPSFHMSIAWCVGDHEEELNLYINQINFIFNELMANFPKENWYIFVEQLVCKTGNKFFHFNLT